MSSGDWFCTLLILGPSVLFTVRYVVKAHYDAKAKMEAARSGLFLVSTTKKEDGDE